MSLVRLIPAVTSIGYVRKLRREEVAKATQTEIATQLLSNDYGCEYCKVYTGCPFTANDVGKLPEGVTTFTMREVMETQSCYIPMLTQNYDFKKIHLFAIMGTARESDFLDLLQAEPKSAHCTDSEGNTPLMLACVARNVSSRVTEALLKSSLKEDVNSQNHDGLTALHFAVLNNKPDLVEELIAQGADINAGSVKIGTKYYGLTPLLMTVVCNRTDENRCLDVLLKYNPDVNVECVRARFFGDANSLHFSQECDCGGCISRAPHRGCLLPPSKIKTVEWDPVGSAVYLATLHDMPTNLSTLLNAYDEDERHHVMFDKDSNDQCFNLCGATVKNLRPNTLKVLIDKESSIVNKTTNHFNGFLHASPLHLVLLMKRCFEGHFFCAFCKKTLTLNPSKVMEVLDPLLDCPVINVNARIGNGRQHTPLLMAADKGHDYAIEKLLNRGADPTAVDVDGHTAVDLALQQKPDICFKILKVLFKTGLSHEINGQTFASSLTLQRVSEKKDIDILTLFRQAGALSESNRLTMYNMVLATDVQEELQEKKKQFLKALHTADPFPLQQIVQMYLSAKAGIESPQKRPEVVKEVIQKFLSRNDNTNQTGDHDAKENEVDKRGHTSEDENVSTKSYSSDDEESHLIRLSGIVQDLLHFNLRDVGVKPQ